MTVGISYSHFEVEYIKEVIRQNYSEFSEKKFRLRLFNNGFNVLYHLADYDGGSYMFRIRPAYEFYDITEETVTFVLDYQEFLLHQSFPVPKIEKTVEDKLFGYIDAPEGKRFFSLHHVVPGKTEFPLDESQSKLMGKYLATMHQLSQYYEPATKRIYFTTERMIEIPRLLLEQYPDAFKANQDWFISVIQETMTRLSESNFDDFVIIHGDFWHGNAVVDTEQNNVNIIDFDFASYGPKELDIASFLILGLQQYIKEPDKFSEVERMFYDMIEGYHEVWDDAIDMKLIYDIALARLVWMIGGYFAVIGTHAFAAIQRRIQDLTVILQQLLKIKG